MDFMSLLLSPSGRIGREDFWIGFLILCALSVVLLMIPFLGHVALLATTYCWICLYIKRLHDLGRPAGLIAIPYLIWIVPIVVAAVMGGIAVFNGLLSGDDAGTSFSVLAGLGGFLVASGIAFLVGVGFLLWMGIAPGEPGENRYGAPPHAHPLVPPPSSPSGPPSNPPPSGPPPEA
jgi:uncharacterized membrane protein YhaH (DUF805 family)